MAKVNFKRIEDSSLIDNYDVEDGSFWITGDGKSYIDYGQDRISTSGTPDLQMSDISRNTVENKVIKQYIDTLSQNIGGKIIWTNQNSTSSFGSGTITLDESLDNYNMYEIIFSQTITNPRNFSSGKIPVGSGTILGYLVGGVYFYRPTGETVTSNSIYFESARSVSAQTGAVTEDNTRVIPLYVIGYKTGLFS